VNNLHYCIESALPEVISIGEGTVRLLRGWCFHTERRVRALDVRIGNRSVRIRHVGDPRGDVARQWALRDPNGHSLQSGFWGLVPLGKDLVGTQRAVSLVVHLNRVAAAEVALGTVRFISLPDLIGPPPPTAGTADRQPLVAICMATYRPDLEAFRRQIESIAAQTHRHWYCIINDDASPAATFAGMQEICSADPRFLLFRNEENLGVYRNFERCLQRVSPTADFVALSDQDDYWYACKLATQLTYFDSATTLVYSDVRLVTDDGRVLADTYWTNRRNSYDDLGMLLIANTVTGAASIFRRSLLPRILPFPQHVRGALHDHWIACVALATGKIAYADRPLHDYVQHGRNEIGHYDFARITLGQRFRRMLASVAGAAVNRTALMAMRRGYLAVYAGEYRRLHLTTAILKLRTPPESPQRAALEIFSDTLATVPRLIRLHLRIVRRHATTDDAEVGLLLAYVMYRVNRVMVRIYRRTFMRRLRSIGLEEKSTVRR